MRTVESFLKHVLRSGVLSRAQLDDALREAAPSQREDSESLAEYLVQAGRLSRFQAGKLLDGKSVGLVLGPYQILAPIGKGGMSRVYLARDERQQRLVALKVLPPDKAREEERHLARFLREMELCQCVSHPNLAQTLEVGVSQGVYYIAMEYIPGRSLYRLVNAEGPLKVRRAAFLFAQVASALDHAHARGLVHRDLKPSNILIRPDDQAKVLDLGLAIIQGEPAADHTVVGGQGYVVGSMDYLAPEQAEDAFQVDPRSDLYGLGCTLYFALTGTPPFPGGTAVQKILRHRTEEPTAIRRLNRAVPEGFASLVGRLMRKRPEDRTPSAATLRQELLPWIDSTPMPVELIPVAGNGAGVVVDEDAADRPSADGPRRVANAPRPRNMPGRLGMLHGLAVVAVVLGGLGAMGLGFLAARYLPALFR
jgi:serine/threonine protein kinase